VNWPEVASIEIELWAEHVPLSLGGERRQVESREALRLGITGLRRPAARARPIRIRDRPTVLDANRPRNGFPVTAIEDREMHVIQGMAAGGSRVKLYFDSETGLLARQLRYTQTMVGTIPIQIDYSDYRDVVDQEALSLGCHLAPNVVTKAVAR
jgi:hypothetical protein